MGTGELLILDDDRERAAKIIAKRAGLLSVCKYHDIYYAQVSVEGDYSSAYKLGNSLITNGDPLVDCFGKDRKLMTDTIKQVVDECWLECVRCAEG